MKIAYFVNQYPKVSHTFIRREILALERQGLQIQRIALRGWDEKLVDQEDRLEQQNTRYVLRDGILPLFAASLRVLLSRPSGFGSALMLAIKLGWRADRPMFFHLIYFLEACQTYCWVKQSGAEHMHAHFGTNPSEILMLVNALSGIPFSFTVHGPEEFDRPVFLKLRQKIQAATFVIAISSFGRSQLLRWASFSDWKKIKQVHCGLEPNFYQQHQQSLPTQNRIVCVGRLCEQKGQLLLVEAVNVLNKLNVAFELVLAGDGEMREEIGQLIADYQLAGKVRITGWISSTQVRQTILESKALVLPSFAEGLPVVIMEAMSLKRPVISTYIAGIPELVEHAKNGWLVPAGSVNALVDVLLELFNAPTERLEEMGVYAHEAVLARHAVDVEARKLASLFLTSDDGG